MLEIEILLSVYVCVIDFNFVRLNEEFVFFLLKFIMKIIMF